jgi:iron complex outermembrane receptor protein
VGLVYDDVVQESIALKGFPVFDVEQVELLRGRRAPCSAATRRPA